MKDKYICSDSKIIATDDKLGLIEYDYQDNIDEILIKENIIEQIQKEIESANYALGVQETTKKTKYSKTKYFLNVIIPTIAVPTVFALLNIGLIITILSLLLGLLGGVVLTAVDISDANKVKNKINALSVKIQKLQELLVQENKKLDKLKKDKTSTLTEEQKNDMQFKENNLNEISKLLSLEQLYYICGYYINLFYKYEKKGILKDILHDEYNDNELEIIQEVVREKGPTLVKKKRKK